jgi:hypothetical protein
MTLNDLPEKLGDQFSPEQGCILPCFAQLEPQTTEIQAVKEFFDSIDYEPRLSTFDGNPSYQVNLFKDRKSVMLYFITAEQRLQQVQVRLNSFLVDDTIFAIDQVISDLGTPEQVFFAFGGPPLEFHTVLVYNDQGVMLLYTSEFAAEPDDNAYYEPLNLCFSQKNIDIYHIEAWLQSPEASELVEANQPDLYDDDKGSTRPWWSLQKVTGLTEAEFADSLLKDPDQCIEALSLNEMKEQGYIF